MNQKAKICIVAIGYNRPEAMMRLLKSISEADYEEDTVDLMISIDRGEKQLEIVALAEDFSWKNGNKKIRAFSERQGLRSHVVQCGDVVLDYDAVIVLEDDITVSKGFYNYIKQAAEFYNNDRTIAGISLYKHSINVGVNCFFEPEFNGYDVYMMQYAQSWGQCWTRRMWLDFREWYNKNEDIFSSDDLLMSKIPHNIHKWGNQSWLKYYIAYIVEKDLFFVYPYHALSTNHTAVGQHNVSSNNDYQVAMVDRTFNYRFPDFKDAVKYDVFFERTDYKIAKYEERTVIIDLYGNKQNFFEGDILISTARHPYKVLEQWKLKYRPHEINCVKQESGYGIFVYDLKNKADLPKMEYKELRTRYDVRSISWKKLIKLSLSEIKTAITIKIEKKFRLNKK